MKRVSVVGLGYIGLPSSIVAAQAGYEVCGFDIDHDRVEQINAGNPVIFEPEVAERLWKVLKNKTFKAYTDVQFADIFVIAVPTPVKKNKKVDLSAVFSAVEAIGSRLRPGNLVIIESTIPVGTTARAVEMLEEISSLKVSRDFFVAHCPERVLPGKIFAELVSNDRVVGGVCQKSCDLVQAYYSAFVTGFIHVTDDKTAEMVKLVENSSRDCQLAFANQVAAIAQEAGLDPYHVIDLANKHPRVHILNPTCGVGGHCIAVDPWFLVETFPQQTALLRLAREINDQKPLVVIDRILDKIIELQARGIQKPRVLLLGLTFKPNVDDVRESPALLIATTLVDRIQECELLAYDPFVSVPKISNQRLSSPSTLKEGMNWADLVVILVKHHEFEVMKEDLLLGKVLIDTCGLLYDLQAKRSHDLLRGAVKVSYHFRDKSA